MSIIILLLKLVRSEMSNIVYANIYIYIKYMYLFAVATYSMYGYCIDNVACDRKMIRNHLTAEIL